MGCILYTFHPTFFSAETRIFKICLPNKFLKDLLLLTLLEHLRWYTFGFIHNHLVETPWEPPLPLAYYNYSGRTLSKSKTTTIIM